jgi:hypothetical protein
MDTNPNPTGSASLACIVGDIARSLSVRGDQSPQRQADRARLATETIGAFQPRDVIEAMLAGHCVMFHALIVDGVQHALSDETGAARRPEYRIVVAMDKAFGNNLARLEAHRTRRAEAVADAEPEPAGAEPEPAGAETDIAARIQRHLTPVPGRRSATAEPVATRRADPEASAGLHDADPARLATVPGMGWPGESQPVVSARMSGVADGAVLNQAHRQRSVYVGNRQARRHPHP